MSRRPRETATSAISSTRPAPGPAKRPTSAVPGKRRRRLGGAAVRPFLTARSRVAYRRRRMNRRLTQRGRDRRRQLMEYAGRRFAENGYHPTSVAEIVQGIGVGKGVFYWYFSSKEELFSEILREAQQELRRRQQAAIGDEADPVRRIELGIRASMDWLSENRHLFTLLQFAVSDERRPPREGGRRVGARPGRRPARARLRHSRRHRQPGPQPALREG
ncbi:MAG: TetR/AcrR family transcriptional regulator [Actinobacteria bacterium]|nr:MAG: TetR/AcrR family transcriptional regulator [Actinomycetota bacterium]